MNWLSEILALIEKIPNTFWGVVIGSFFSLGGVFLSNRANDKRLRQQLAHDRELKNRERELSLRKDVYLAAAEAISIGITTLGSFSNLEIQDDKLTSAFVEKHPAIDKVHVIANEATAAAVLRLTGELGASYLRLLAKRIPLIQQKRQIANLKEQIKGFESVRDRMLELMRQHNIAGEINQQKFSVLERNFEFEQQRTIDATQELYQLEGDLVAKLLAFTKDCISESATPRRFVVPALVAFRTELELPIDEASYAKMVDERIKRQEEMLSEFIKQVQPTPASQIV